VRRFFYLLLRLAMAGAAVGWLGGCGWHREHKPQAYDRSISQEEKDPTYRPDVERADVEVREAR